MNNRDLRVSDSEREHVVSLLQKATGRGMLDLDEFTRRSEKAYAAKTRGELNTLLVDLPGLVHTGSGTDSAIAQERLVLTGRGSTVSRAGEWTVPRTIVVRTSYGTTRLDFSRARIVYPVVGIVLKGKWGTVELVVPDGSTVDTSGVGNIKWGKVEDSSRHVDSDGVRFVVTGAVHGGALKIRNPRRGLFG